MPKKKFASNKSLGHSLMNKQGFKPHVSQINKVDGFVVVSIILHFLLICDDFAI